MSTSKVFQRFYAKLVKTLPMDDALFIAELFSANLLPGNIKNQVKSMNTKADKATHFLDHVIQPSVASGVGKSFDDLIEIMADSEYDGVKELAKLIRCRLKEAAESSETSDLLSATAHCTRSDHSVKPFPIDVVVINRLRSRYCKHLSTDDTDWPHPYIRLALVKGERVTRADKKLEVITKLTLQGQVDEILLRKEQLSELNDIFHFENKPCPRVILIMGGPGIGKTTLANEICVRWAKGNGFLAKDFDAVILIQLRSVQQRSIEEVMAELIGEEAYVQLKKAAGSRCLIILEGLDEMGAERQKKDPFLKRVIENCSLLEVATIIITSRPHACKNLKCGRIVEVVGFGIEQIKEFVQKAFPNDSTSADTLLQQLVDYPQIQSLCYVPLNLVMVTDIFQFYKQKLPSTVTELYKCFIVMTLQRQSEKDQELLQTSSLPVANDVEEWLCRTLPGIPKQSVGKLWRLVILAFHGFNWHSTYVNIIHYMPGFYFAWAEEWKEAKIIFTEEDLKQCGIEVTSQFDGYGLLNATHTHQLPMDTVTYSFSHLTIQEFLCALFIATISQQDQQNLLFKYFHAFPNVSVFFSGLTKLESSEQFKFVYDTLTKGLMNNPGFITALKCIYEIQLSSTSCQSASPFTFDLSSYSMVLPHECMFISHVLSHYPVAALIVQMSDIGDKGAKFLEDCYNNKSYAGQHLAALDVCKCELTVDGLKYVLKIVEKNIRSLRMLNIGSNNIGDEGALLVSKTFQCNNFLTELNMGALGENFTAKGIECVAEMLVGKNVLQVLKMGWNNVTDDGMSAISSALKCNTSLTELSLIMSKISPRGATYMSEALMVNRTLQVLNMSLNPFLDDGITAVASAFGVCHLTCLDIDGCGITDIGANSVAAGLRVNQSITKLSMKGNGGITKEGTRLILQSAVDNGTCLQVELNEAFDEQVNQMLSILEKRATKCIFT